MAAKEPDKTRSNNAVTEITLLIQSKRILIHPRFKHPDPVFIKHCLMYIKIIIFQVETQ